VEEDGVGLGSDELRAAVLASTGARRLIVDGRNRVLAVRRVTQALSLPHPRAIAILKRNDGVLWEGTQTECVWLSMLLANIGIATTIE
jgi:hypothetical protein